ncbi:nitric-oxide reductase NorE protein [Brucella abortus bv. 5 str. B3196]|nr:nitric-oxide reductase NorE protein [Brucella abortus bv. 5 str. B3196]
MAGAATRRPICASVIRVSFALPKHNAAAGLIFLCQNAKKRGSLRARHGPMLRSEDNAIAALAAGEGQEEEDSLLLWVLVWSELITFAILLVAFMVMSVVDPQGVGLLRAHLSPGLAATNTVILLMSGWQAALAVRRRNNPKAVRRPLLFAALFGFCFVAVKLLEYSHEARFAGNEAAGSFFELYFLITGFHLLHVLFGSVILMLVAWRPSRSNVLLIATLWHAIDLVWLVMFPILYLA